ncbi:MAG: hypothetical protein RKO25_08395 [Candidatus Contendobacter sp.]|nr:hypothetical protein [Candidatus Contendobacter sp.]
MNDTVLLPAASTADPSCKICTIRLEQLCYRRAWWFRPFREVLATGIRLFALVYGIRRYQHVARSRLCYGCLRFRKNALLERSALFRWGNSFLNPLFNRVRDSLLTPVELDMARTLARRAADTHYVDAQPASAAKSE